MEATLQLHFSIALLMNGIVENKLDLMKAEENCNFLFEIVGNCKLSI